MAKPLPQSLHDRAELLARVHQLQVVAELIGVPRCTITKMKKRGWKAGDYSGKVRQMPADFAWMSNRMTHQELCDHYKAGARTVCRWLKQCPNVRKSRRGEALRRDKATGKRVWQARRAG